MSTDDDFALPTSCMTEEELAELRKSGLDDGEYEAIEKVAAEELADPDFAAPCEPEADEPIEAEDEFAAPATAGEGKAEEGEDDFALPDESGGPAVAQQDEGEGGEGGTYQPWESRIPSTIITQELQKAMYRARIILHHTFELVNTNEGKMLNRLIEEKPDVYADLVLRLAITHFITWQKAMGL